MTLSVIIVSYNVKYFLEQCMCSVQRALGNDMEVIVVDNNSSDGTVEYLQQRFSFVRFIVNKENPGFAKANNQAWQAAAGRYVLFLNPDTIIPEDLFIECIAFMDSKADAGALGVRMVDGSGRFLKESKRGFPSPWVAFCKMSGLTKLFPRSAAFARYYMGHLPEKEINEVDALAGACMLLRKEVLDKTGGFDEQFFMYAEDIDLSYRVKQAGYKNYYFPHTTIIHFKGESTMKDARYVRLFYKAMVQFSNKHFGKNSDVKTNFLVGAIKTRAALASLLTGKGAKNAEHHYRFYFSIGDEDSIEEIPPISSSSSKAKRALTFAEGHSFTFKQVIHGIQQKNRPGEKFIHGRGTYSVVGSGSKNTPGATFSWSESYLRYPQL